EGSSVGVSRTVFDKAGNSVAGGVSGLKVDLHAPAAPSAPVLPAANDTGVSNSDGITSDATPPFTGTAEPGSTVTLLDSGTPLGAVIAAAGGTYSFAAVPLSNGAHTLTATAIDPAGNGSAPSAALSITIDSIAPSTP